jgi:hypothetical protein
MSSSLSSSKGPRLRDDKSPFPFKNRNSQEIFLHQEDEVSPSPKKISVSVNITSLKNLANTKLGVKNNTKLNRGLLRKILANKDKKIRKLKLEDYLTIFFRVRHFVERLQVLIGNRPLRRVTENQYKMINDVSHFYDYESLLNAEHEKLIYSRHKHKFVIKNYIYIGFLQHSVVLRFIEGLKI